MGTVIAGRPRHTSPVQLQVICKCLHPCLAPATPCFLLRVQSQLGTPTTGYLSTQGQKERQDIQCWMIPSILMMNRHIPKKPRGAPEFAMNGQEPNMDRQGNESSSTPDARKNHLTTPALVVLVDMVVLVAVIVGVTVDGGNLSIYPCLNKNQFISRPKTFSCQVIPVGSKGSHFSNASLFSYAVMFRGMCPEHWLQ
jgi:hypothetical protein